MDFIAWLPSAGGLFSLHSDRDGTLEARFNICKSSSKNNCAEISDMFECMEQHYVDR